MIEAVLGGAKGAYMIPFFWQHGEERAVLREELDAIQGAGIRALCIESRPHPDFLGEGWWRDMDFIMEECRRRGMQVWLLDDARFPTGYAAGAAKNSPHRKLFLKEKHVDIKGPQSGASLLIEIPEGDGKSCEDDQILAIVAARRIPGANMDHSTFINLRGDAVSPELIDLSPQRMGDVVYWDVPEGLWRIFIMALSRDSGNPWQDQYLNPLEWQGGKILLDAVYEPHYDRYRADFGKTLRGFFSDEPQFGCAYGYHAMLGSYPFLPLPWCDEIPALLDEALDADSRPLWPGLWYDIGEKTADIRYAYMNTVSRLYGENFAGQVGDWCRARGVEYMGHVIEENNAHARLGAGAGHYFRALWGQDYAGIDLVLHGVIPGIKGGSHAQSARMFEADDDFFYYMLGQMAASLSHIDPKKQGRAMCEIFGAYGWQEGMRQMKWLADFMLARGINRFVPHAFSPKAFPDPDSAPHFYARGENPQYRYFHLLMDYMDRVCALGDGGVHCADAAVLYHGEAEWTGAPMMKTQEPIRALNQRQLEADIVPLDVLESAAVAQGRLHIHRESYTALIIPRSDALPAAGLARILALAQQGLPVLFADALPVRAVGGDFPLEALRACCRTVPLGGMADAVSALGRPVCQSACFEPDLKIYPLRKEGGLYVLLFNENIDRTLAPALTFCDARPPFLYDPLENTAVTADFTRGADGVHVRLSLPPYALRVVAFEDTPPALKRPAPLPPRAIPLTGMWAVSASDAREYPTFHPLEGVAEPGNLNRPDKYPRFSGTIRYETHFENAGSRRAVLDLGTVGEIAEVRCNESMVGVRFTPPYRFDLTPALREGENILQIDVTNTLVYRLHDRQSGFHAIGPSGLVGPLTLYTE